MFIPLLNGVQTLYVNQLLYKVNPGDYPIKLTTKRFPERRYQARTRIKERPKSSTCYVTSVAREDTLYCLFYMEGYAMDRYKRGREGLKYNDTSHSSF